MSMPLSGVEVQVAPVDPERSLCPAPVSSLIF